MKNDKQYASSTGKATFYHFIYKSLKSVFGQRNASCYWKKAQK